MKEAAFKKRVIEFLDLLEREMDAPEKDPVLSKQSMEYQLGYYSAKMVLMRDEVRQFRKEHMLFMETVNDFEGNEKTIV